MKIKEKEVITPELAAKWLSANKSNRPLRNRLVSKYARDITEDRWQYNGESIKFNRKGELIDGQHRLSAVVKAHKPITSIVLVDVDNDCFHTIDTGRSRNVADILYIAGERDQNNLAAALRLLTYYNMFDGDLSKLNSRSNDIFISEGDIQNTLDKHPGIRASIPKSIKCKTARLLQPSVGAVAHYMFSKVDEEMADDFFERLSEGNDLQNGNPILALRNRLIRMGNTGASRIDQTKKMALLIDAWNKWRRGDKMYVSSFKADAEYPRIDD